MRKYLYIILFGLAGAYLFLTWMPSRQEKSGPISLAPSINLSSDKLKQGDTLLVRIDGVENLSEISGEFGSFKMKFFKSGGKIFSLIGIDAKKTPGIYKLAVNLPDSRRIERHIEVLDGNFSTTALAFTPELEKKGFNAVSVAETIIKKDGPKLAEALAVSADTAYFDKPFIYPLDKIVDVGAFGNIRKSGDISLQHLGTDLDADANTPVYAVNDGLVEAELELADYGKTIVIDHGLGIFSLYLHMEKFNVTEGQRVVRGQIIGLSGNTGYSTEPHLHFSIKINGASVDPLKFIASLTF